MIGELAALGSAACWALASLLFERVGKDRVSAGALNLAKCTMGAGVLLAATALARGRALPEGVTGAELGMLAASAAVGLAVGDTAFFAALKAVGSSRALLLLSMAPIFVVALESTGSGRFPPLSELRGIGLALGGLGVVLWRPGEGVISWKGVGWGLVAALGQAGGNLLSRAATQGKLDALSASWFRLAVGAAGVLAVGLAGGQGRAWRRELGAGGVLGRVAVAAFFGTVLGLSLMQAGLSYSRSGGVASALISLSPIFSLPLARWAGTERVTGRAVVGAAVATAGVVWLLRGGG